MEKQKAHVSYIRDTGEEKHFRIIGMIFLVVYFIMPQYLGVQVAGFDLTAQRFMMLIMLLHIFTYKGRAYSFLHLVKTEVYTPYILMFMFVTFYTMGLRADINSFLQSAIEFICLYILIYFIKNSIGVEKLLKAIIIMLYILCILGLVEYVLQSSPFHLLATIPGKYAVQIRSGSYRIMGPCNHALGYGLLLVSSFPLICIDYKNNVLNLMQNKMLLLLMILNIFLNGSRSTLGILILEILLIMVFSTKENRRRSILYIIMGILFLAVFLVVFYKISFAQYILRQIASVIDEVLGTTYAANFGAEISRLEDSSLYRSKLIKIFALDWLNPLLGRGVSRSFGAVIDGMYIVSIDNFYVAQYIRFAYPGLITYVLFIVTSVFRMLKKGYEQKSGVIYALFIGALGYYINLWWLDSLQTLKYVYLLFAIFAVVSQKEENETKIGKKSKYIR